MNPTTNRRELLRSAMASNDASVRLNAALAAGTHPESAFADLLVARFANEPDFYVRDMLTWALVQHDRADTLPLLRLALDSAVPQSRSQALHTLSKLGEPSTWPWVTDAMLTDADDEVARAAWRTAAGLAPDDQRGALAATLGSQFGRGNRQVQLSLSQALASLGDAAKPVIAHAMTSRQDTVRAHARATQRIIADPDAGFDDALDRAKREVALRGAPMVDL